MKVETNLKSEIRKTKRFDLEDRLLQFAKDVRLLVKNLPKQTSNFEDGKQIVRSSGSVGANYIEANESLSKKDFKMRLKISKKEARETVWWLELVDVSEDLEKERRRLLQETTELINILGAILRKAS